MASDGGYCEVCDRHFIQRRKEERQFHNSNTWREKREKILKHKPLLTIELEDETSVPKVFYKGEEVTLLRNVQLNWETDTDEFGGLSYDIEHFEKDKGYPIINRIKRKVRGHAFN